MHAQTLKHMKPDARVVIELKDGRRVVGVPRRGPESQDDGIDELYLVYPQASDAQGVQQYVGEGIIIPLAEISNIVLEEDPTTRRGVPARELDAASEQIDPSTA
jgi:hypothetical protein